MLLFGGEEQWDSTLPVCVAYVTILLKKEVVLNLSGLAISVFP